MACLEGIALRQGWISPEEMKDIGRSDAEKSIWAISVESYR